jgi:NitT/TauT family transport system substrate-binding protein
MGDNKSKSMDYAKRNILQLLGAAWLAPLAGCAPKAPFRIAGHPWPGYEPIFLAESQRMLPSGVVLQHLPTIKASIDALRDGTTDAAMVALNEVLPLRLQGLDLRVVLVMDVSKGADALVAHKDIQTLSQLRGKRIGMEPSTLGELMLSMVLERAGLKRDEVKPVPLAYEQQEDAYSKGALDALISYEPVTGRLIAAGAQKLISTRELPVSILDVLVVKADVAKDYLPVLQQTLKAHFLALERLRRNPWDTAYRMVPHAGVPAEELIESFRGLELPDLVANRSYLSAGNGHLLKLVKKLSDIMVAAGTIAQPVEAEQLFTDVYLPKSLE